MKNKISLILLFVAFTQLYSQDVNTFFEKTTIFFNLNVDNGKIAYSKINSNKEGLFELMKMAETIEISKKDSNTYQAFWINVYNLSVIKGIIDNYPINSPLDKNGFFDTAKFKLGGKNVTLNDIENELLRAQFNDARFHFVLVCGAIGCPPIINKAYLPTTLESQLKEQTELALNGDYFIKVNEKKKRVEVSEIMKWYQEDFIKNGMSEIEFINQYRKDKIPTNYKLSYYPYNWDLNKQ